MEACGPNPQQMERRFRELLDESGIEQPDRVEHCPDAHEIVFYWEDERVAVVLDLKPARIEPPV